MVQRLFFRTLQIYNTRNTMFHTAPSWMNNIIQLSPKENVNFKPTEKEKENHVWEGYSKQRLNSFYVDETLWAHCT